MRLKSASYWEIGSSWPLQSDQPTGAKLNPTIRISPINGVAISNLQCEDIASWTLHRCRKGNCQKLSVSIIQSPRYQLIFFGLLEMPKNRCAVRYMENRKSAK